MTIKKAAQYINNPFNIGLEGIKLFYAKARPVAIFAIIICALLMIWNSISTAVDSIDSVTKSEQQLTAQQESQEQAVADFFSSGPEQIIPLVVLAVTAIFIIILWLVWLYAVIDYTAAKLAEDERVGLKEALKESGKELASYLWVYIIITVKIILWSLLFIIPGFIMAVRYSLAGTIFFAEGKRGNAAIKRSLELTKGAWFTTFAGSGLWNLITFGQITYFLQPGVNAVLYRQFKETTKKPAMHWLSWATLIIPIALVGMFVGLIVLLVVAYALAGGNFS